MGRVVSGGRWGRGGCSSEKGHKWGPWVRIGQFNPYREKRCECCGAQRVQSVKKKT